MVPRFYESIKPWDSITIPALSCPEGSYLVDQHLSPGRLVPKGVEVTELRNGLEPAGAVGVTIRDARAVAVEVRQRLSCPDGSYLVDEHLSPGRLVPKGVEVTELRNGIEPAGAVGVTIRDARAVAVEVKPGAYALPLVGTRVDQGFSTATNWDPAASHTIVIRLHCTTDLNKAAKGLATDL